MTQDENFGTTMYRRYGGLLQLSAPSVEEQKYDDACQAIDALEAEIAAFPLSLFTAAEFMWFSRHVNKMYVFPNQAQLDAQLETLRKLRGDLVARKV